MKARLVWDYKEHTAVFLVCELIRARKATGWFRKFAVDVKRLVLPILIGCFFEILIENTHFMRG